MTGDETPKGFLHEIDYKNRPWYKEIDWDVIIAVTLLGSLLGGVLGVLFL